MRRIDTIRNGGWKIQSKGPLQEGAERDFLSLTGLVAGEVPIDDAPRPAFRKGGGERIEIGKICYRAISLAPDPLPRESDKTRRLEFD
jgi:hypothetical protein